MDNTKSIKQYDLFKLIVTIVLLLAFLCLLLLASKRDSTPSSDAPPLSTPTSDSVPQATASPTAELPTTSVPTEIQQHLPTSEPTKIPITTATDTPVAEATSATDGETIADIKSCEEIAKSQIQIDMTVEVLQRLNFRSSPSVQDNRILTHRAGDQARVIGGPTCTRYLGGGAYLWWQLELPNGLVGWSAEASTFGAFYFMEPAE